MRFALVIDYALDYLGGAQSAFLDAARVLERSGHDVTVIAPRRGLFEATSGLTGDSFGVATSWTLPGVDLPVIRNTHALREQLRREFVWHGIESVQVHSEFGLAAAAIHVAHELRIPTVHTIHTFFWTAIVPAPLASVAALGVRGFARWLRGYGPSGHGLADSSLDAALRGITHSLAARADQIVSPSTHQATALRHAGLGSIRVIPNPDAAGTEPGPPLRNLDGPLRVTWVGRLAREKRPEVLAEASLLAARVVGVDALRVEFVGDGPLAKRLQQWERRGAPIRLVGRLPRTGVSDRMRRAHLVALTSYGFDNQPVVVIEALHERRGILVADPALTEGLDTGAALRPATPDAAGIAALLIELVRDPAPILAASEEAKRAAQTFAPSRYVEAVRETSDLHSVPA